MAVKASLFQKRWASNSKNSCRSGHFAHAARAIASCIVVTQTRASAIAHIQQETSIVLFSHSVLTRGILNTNRVFSVAQDTVLV